MHDLNFRSSQAESKIRIQKLDKTANRCNSRIHKYFKISLWIRYPSKIIPSTVNLFNPLTFGTKITRPLTFAFHFKRTYWNIQTSTKDWFMVRILRIFQNLPSAMTSASSEETSFGFHRGEGITYSSESFRRKQTTIDVRFQGGQTATKLQHVLLPNISNKEGREAWVMGLDYSKQAVENTYQCHFVLYFVSASIDPSSDIIGSLEHWIDSFIRQDF